MYTVVKKPEIPGHRGRGDRPSLEVIDHRKKYQGKPYEESYEKLRQQREALLDAEMKYQRRIRELEKEAAEVARAQEATQTENKSLKNFLQRGPKATNIKKVKLENNQLQDVVKKLHEDNRDLVQLINRMEKRDEDEWQDAFEETRRRQEQRYSVFGPFVAGLNGKKSTITLNDPTEKTVTDNYDRELLKLSKQTKTLMNKFEQMQRVKRSIDFATVMGPSQKCTTNVVKHRAIGDKLNLDLNKYSARLEALTTKHERMTDALITSLSETEVDSKPTKKSKQKAILAPDGGKGLQNGETLESEKKTTKKGLANGNGGEVKGKSKSQARKTETEAMSTFLTEIPVNKTVPNDSPLLSDTETDEDKERKWQRKTKRVKSVSPGKTHRRKSGENIPDNSQDQKTIKWASPADQTGIHRGGENSKKGERVKFEVESGEAQYKVKPKSKIETKSSIEETWDNQRVKMKVIEQSARKRPASKSASTVRKRSVETIKIKSELDNYNDTEDTFDTGREGATKRNLGKGALKPRSPLLYESVLKQTSANDVGLDNYSRANAAASMKVPKLSLNQRKGSTLKKNYELEESPHSTGRYTHGPESVKDTNNTLAFIEGPDSVNGKVQSKRIIGREMTQRRRSNAGNDTLKDKSSTVTAYQNFDLDQPKPVYDDFIRRENKSSGVKPNVTKRNNRSAKSSAKSARGFPRHPPISKDSIHLEREPNSKVVLNYLKHNTDGSPVDFSERYVDKDEQLLSPVPVMFRDDARTFGRKPIRFVSREDRLRPEIEHRRGEFYRSYLNEND